MKKTKRFLAVVLCMLLMLTPLAVVAETGLNEKVNSTF